MDPDLLPPVYTFMLQVPETATENTIISLVPGKVYRFKVLATSAVGDSALSS